MGYCVFTSSRFTDSVLQKLEMCSFFEAAISYDIFFLTVHDAVLHIEHDKKYKPGHDPLLEKVCRSPKNIHLNDRILYRKKAYHSTVGVRKAMAGILQ